MVEVRRRMTICHECGKVTIFTDGICDECKEKMIDKGEFLY